MATNLATILVQLQTNTSNFQSKMNTAGKSVEKFGKKQDAVNKKAVGGNKKLQNAFRDTAGTIAAVQGPLGPVAGRINSLGAIIGRVSIAGIALTAAFVAVGFALRKVIKDVAGAEQQFFKLQAILRATGNSAGLSLQEIETLSQEIGIATLASTQKVRDAAGILLTFKSIQGDVFKNALRLTQDLSEVGFGDLRTASMQLGKALEEPIVGLGALRRVGVSFTEAQKEQIRVLDMTGRKAEAQEIILRALNTQVGGAGVEAARGLNGAIDSLSERFTIFFEKSKVGRAVVDFLTASLNKLSGAAENAMQDAESLNTTMEVANRILLTQEKIATRVAELNESMFFEMNVGEDKKLNALNEQLESLKARERVLEAIAKDNEETAKKEEELYGTSKKNDIIKVTDLEKIRINQQKDFNRNTDRTLENLGKTKHELRELNALRKIEDKLRSELKSQGPEAEAAIAEQMKIVNAEQEKRNLQVREAIDLQTQLDKIATGVGSTFASVGDKISDAMARGKLHTLDFADILKEMVVELQKMIFKVLVLDEIQRNIEERIKKTRTSGGGNIISDIFKSIFTKPDQSVPVGEMATGGAVSGSQPRLVGERGPELFVPRTAGSITPSSLTPGAMGGSPINVTQNLNFAVGITNTVRAEVMNMLPAIQNSTLSAVAEAKQRGGKFSKAFGD